MIDLKTFTWPKRSRLTSVLAMTLDGSRLEGLVLRRINGSVQVQTPFSVALSLDPLTNAPELVGREIRNHLDALQVHERHCVVGLPLKWALTAHIDVPELPEGDVASFLHLEAERSFPCDLETLHVGASRATSAGKQQAFMAGVPRNHIAILEQVLHAAKLKPVGFSLGIAALQPPAESQPAEGVLALVIGDSHVGLQITSGGGIVALRTLEGAIETVGGQKTLKADLVAREARITLGQLSAEQRDPVKSIRVFGPRDLARELVDELDLRLESMGLKAEAVTRYGAHDFEFSLPPEAPVSAAFSLAGLALSGRKPVFDFLPPKVTAWQQMSARYASGKLRTVLAAAGGVGLLVGGLFFVQQVQLWNCQRQWARISAQVTELQGLNDKIRQYRPWSDDSVRGLSILRGLTKAFPEDGSVTAKTIEIRELSTVTCTGTAQSYQALLKTVAKLRAVSEIGEAVNLGPTRGQAPALQFSLTLTWNPGGQHAN
jgi:hypothetical protein